MFSFEFENINSLIEDREDLIQVVRMRFGQIPGSMIAKIYEMDDINQLQRLILAAANAKSWEVFLQEFQAEDDSFRIVGDDFNPLGEILNRGNHIDGKKEE